VFRHKGTTRSNISNPGIRADRRRVLLKRILVAASVAGALAVSSVTPAEAGPLRDKVKFALSRAKDSALGLVRTGGMITKCELKAKRGAFAC